MKNSRKALDLLPKEIYRGMIRLYALHRATKAPLSSRQLADQLLRRGYALSTSSVTPILRALAKKGFLMSGQTKTAPEQNFGRLPKSLMRED